MAHKFGYSGSISTNPAMVLGGLKEGVTPLGWTYAYSTLGNNGDRISGTLAPRPGDSPVAYTKVTDSDGNVIRGGDNDSTHEQVVDESVALEAKRILETVVSSGTGTNADTGAEGEWGKTGTTENNGDAWFCGGVQDKVTACVWVGYADTVTPMTTLYQGGPVMGGTFPALIWASVISAWEDIQTERAAEKAARKAEREAKKEAEENGEEFDAGEYEYVPTEPTEESYEVEGGSEGAIETEEVAPEEEVEATPEVTPEATPEGTPEGGGGGGGGVTAG